MSDWMRRRIERSRARCEKSATSPKPDKREETTKQADGQAAPTNAQAAPS